MKNTCPNCQSASKFVTRNIRFGNKADVRKCGSCDLTYLDQNSFEFPENFYEHDYHQTYLTHVEPDALDPLKYYEKMQKATLLWVDKLNEMLNGDEIILDVGCSTGHFITSIQDAAGEVYGHEISKKEVAFCRNELKIDVSDEPLEERFESGMFDYITMIFVLEHIAQPLDFLNHLKKFLKPNGNFVIVVPNINDPLVSFYDIPTFREFYYCIEHLYYYSPKTIGDLFEKAKLSGIVETVQEYPIMNHLNWAYRQKPSETLAARRLVPDLLLKNETLSDKWQLFWDSINDQYKTFLKANGVGDRIWCVVGLE